jgi:hypothetical protein
MAQAIRHPTHRNAGGIPHRAVLRDLRPGAVIIEILNTRDVRVHVLSVTEGLHTPVALGTPLIEVVRSGKRK